MGKKVCHITSVHNRYDERIFYKECKSLASNGYEVYLVVNDNKGDEIIDGVRIVSTQFQPSNRIERIFFSAGKIKKIIKQIDAEIFQIHDPELLPLANVLARKGKRVIFDCHEDVSNQIKDKEWIPGSMRKLISTIYLLYEKYSLRKYKAVISVTPSLVQRLEKYNKNSVMITNYPVIKERMTDRKPERKICFAGGIESQWEHDKIIQAIEGIEDITYVLAGNGNGDYFEYLKSLDGWEKVEYCGRIPFEKVRTLYSKSMAGMAINYSTQARAIGGGLGNTKLFEYMEAGLPIICTNYTIWEDIVKKNNCGIAVDPLDISGIADSIQYLLNNPQIAFQMGQNGREAAEREYNWESQEKILLDLYRKMLR